MADSYSGCDRSSTLLYSASMPYVYLPTQFAILDKHQNIIGSGEFFPQSNKWQVQCSQRGQTIDGPGLAAAIDWALEQLDNPYAYHVGITAAVLPTSNLPAGV
jgi:hypothetical protein